MAKSESKSSNESNSSRQRRTNPFELIFFIGMLAACGHSVYRVYTGWDVSFQGGLGAGVQGPATEGDASRSPASRFGMLDDTRPFQNIEVTCADANGLELKANKVRLIGSLCGFEQDSKFLRVEIKNVSNQASATVFTDLYSRKFSTDYIPLTKGQNDISLSFFYEGGRSLVHQLTVKKN